VRQFLGRLYVKTFVAARRESWVRRNVEFVTTSSRAED